MTFIIEITKIPTTGTRVIQLTMIMISALVPLIPPFVFSWW